MQWQTVRRTYLLLTLFTTLSASFIWGVNTLFLLDAGLSNTQAFSANAAYTLGMVVFEVPTGVVADTRGRRVSFLFGVIALLLATLAYVLLWHLHAAFVWWLLASGFLGLGFTFFSGATEAWLVDALDATGYEGDLESVFGAGQSVAGVAMLAGSVAGGLIAQATNLSVPYILRSVMLVATFGVAFKAMHDIGFTPHREGSVVGRVKNVLADSVDAGFKAPPVRWMILASPFQMGIGIYAFYAMQPYLLELWGDPDAFAVAGVAAAIAAGGSIIGGMSAGLMRRIFRRRTDAVVASTLLSILALIGVGLTNNFWVAVALITVWSVVSSLARPLRSAYLNGEIPSKQRATVLSVDSLTGSLGGVVSQPALGRMADVTSYSATYLVAGLAQVGAIPFLLLARATKAPSDAVVEAANDARLA